MFSIFGQIVGCSACHADHLPEGCTWGSGVKGGLLPWQAAPHLPETHDSHPVAGWPRQDEEGLQGLLVEDPQPVHQPWVRPHRLHEQRQQLSKLLRDGLPIQAAPKPVQPHCFRHFQALGVACALLLHSGRPCSGQGGTFSGCSVDRRRLAAQCSSQCRFGFVRGSRARMVHEMQHSRCSTPQQMMLKVDVLSLPRQLSRCHLLEACPPDPERLYSQKWVNAEQVLLQLTLDSTGRNI